MLKPKWEILAYIIFNDTISIELSLYSKDCAPHFYGSDCNTPCAQCRRDDVCDSVTGHCPNGCKPHWTGPWCDGIKLIQHLYLFLNFISLYFICCNHVIIKHVIFISKFN